jgi:serine/threonine protein kinase/Flp pilus assembly protein TadD
MKLPLPMSLIPKNNPEYNEEGPPTQVVSSPQVALPEIANRLAAEMACLWRQGKFVRAEELLAQNPEIQNQSDAILRLISEEISLCLETNQPLTRRELEERFPSLEEELRRLWEQHRTYEIRCNSSEITSSNIPGDFQVVSELGQGTQGRVLLALQPALADRPVVLKITARKGREYLSLARLLHSNIVPLYWVHDDPDHDQHTLCMPFLGNVTLAQLLTQLSAKPLPLRTGRDILDILDRARGQTPVSLAGVGPARQLLTRTNYVQAVCWIGSCLADALQYAHERGLVHMDVKPANILLAFDGQPMLLDFHLAREPILPGGPLPRGLGGTLAYMAPEQRAALEALQKEKTILVPVDQRADVYALGLVLYQALGGPLPSTASRLDQCNPQVSPGLADLIHKCLERDPQRRYPDAGALAVDLRRHLADLPLRGVPNRSWYERWYKWRRRRPQALALLAVLTVVLVGLVAAGLWKLDHIRLRLEEAQAGYHKGEEWIESKSWNEAVQALEQAQKLAETTPGGGDLTQRIMEKLTFAQKQQGHALWQKNLDQHHGLVSQVRLLSSNANTSTAALTTLVKQSADLWKAGLQLLHQGREHRSKEELLERLRVDLLDVAVIQAESHLRLAETQGNENSRREALQFLEEVQKVCGASPAIHLERKRLAESLGEVELANKAARELQDLPARTVGDHRTLGRALLEASRYAEAMQHFQQALHKMPRDFWANFYLGICAYRLQKYDEAVLAFHGCIMLSSESPQISHCYFNRALAEVALGQTDLAMTHYSEALRLHPSLAPAYLNRGILHTQRENFSAALADLNSALNLGSDLALTHFHLAQVHLAQKNLTMARHHLRQALQVDPGYQDAKDLLNRIIKG